MNHLKPNTVRAALSRLPLPHTITNKTKHHVNAVGEVDQERKYDEIKQSETTEEKDEPNMATLQQDTQWTDIYKCVSNLDDPAWNDKLRREC